MLSEFAPAKVNIFLSIINKRNDGYHNIGTMFHTLSYGDTLFSEQCEDDNIYISYNKNMDYPSEKDLIYKAAIKLKEKYNVKKGVRFYLEKNIPQGAGLGGGSSDAAAALKLLNKLWGLKASAKELELIGAGIGADVAFFINGGAALAEGIGEVLTPVNKIKQDSCVVLVATPNCSVPTVDAYKDITPEGEERWKNYSTHIKKYSSAILPSDLCNFYNHFELSILKKYPLIASLKQKLNVYTEKTLLSGSGASVFALFSSLEKAILAYNAVKNECRFLQICSFL